MHSVTSWYAAPHHLSWQLSAVSVSPASKPEEASDLSAIFNKAPKNIVYAKPSVTPDAVSSRPCFDPNFVTIGHWGARCSRCRSHLCAPFTPLWSRIILVCLPYHARHLRRTSVSASCCCMLILLRRLYQSQRSSHCVL